MRLKPVGIWLKATSTVLLLAMTPMPCVAYANEGLPAYCSDQLDPGSLVTQDCRPVPEPTVAALYSRVSTGTHEEYRDLDRIVVVRQQEAGQWEFLTKDDEVIAAIHRGGADDAAGSKPSVGIYCDQAQSTECSEVAARAHRDFPPLPPAFPLADWYHARSSDSPMAHPSACVVAPACLDPARAPVAYPQVSQSQCLSGTTVVIAYVDGDGCVCDASIQKSSHDRALDRAALNAAEQWKLPAANRLAAVPVAFKAGNCVPPTGSAPVEPGSDLAREATTQAYALALQAAIERQWLRPESLSTTATCSIRIRQIPGGQVIDAQVDPSCQYDQVGRRSIEAAVLKAQPLPYAGFESVFRRDVVLTFRARD